MNLPARLRATERLAMDGTFCLACGGPVPGIDAKILVRCSGEPAPPTCSECGLMVDENGHVLPGAIRTPFWVVEGVVLHKR